MSSFVFIRKLHINSRVTTVVESLPLTVKCCQIGVPHTPTSFSFNENIFYVLVNGKILDSVKSQHNNEKRQGK